MVAFRVLTHPLYALAKDAFVGSDAQTWFETGTFLLAVVVLTYMTFWMKRHARTLGSSLTAQVGAAITGGSAVTLAALAFVTVGREAVETVIFLLTIAVQSSPAALLAGVVVGLALSLALSLAIYRLGVRLDLKWFFTVVGAALMVIAAGLLANAIQNLQELHVLPGGAQTLWDTSRVIPDDSALGDVLHGLIGYAAAPSVLHVAAWVLFLGLGLAAFLREAGPRAPRTTRTRQTAA